MRQIQAPHFMNKRRKGTPVRHSRSTAPGRPPKGAGHVRAAKPNRDKGEVGEPQLSASGVFALSAECTVTAGAALKSSLLQVLEEPTPITLDVAAVRRIDTAAMQLIAAFVRERQAQGREVRWSGSAPVFASAARLLGLVAALRLPEPAQ